MSWEFLIVEEVTPGPDVQHEAQLTRFVRRNTSATCMLVGAKLGRQFAAAGA
jgi:hypothetical protein